MGNEYATDIKELKSLAKCLENNFAVGESSCISYFTEETGEPFLDNRAATLKKTLETDCDLQDAFTSISRECSGMESECQNCLVKKYCNHYINQVRKAAAQGRMKIVDLFCGAGGLSLGFTQEGFVTALANDIEACCVDTYAHNHPETPRSRILQGDIRNLVSNLSSILEDESIDVVIGGPPCQGFSMANRQRLIDDPRNYLYKSYVQIVQGVRPKFFVMENVKGMLPVADQVVEDFNAIGYDVNYQVLNAKDFGVPQSRERLIYIGNRIGINNQAVFEKIKDISNDIPNFVLEDALFGLRPLSPLKVKNTTDIDSEESGRAIEKQRCFDTNDYLSLINQGRIHPILFNHKARYNNERDIEIFRRLNPGDKSDDPKIADIMPYARRNGIFRDKYYKLQPDKICKTITAHMKFDCNMYIHPYEARGLTPREAARVQSYPDDYFFRGAYTKTYMQIGNSVPPLLGRAIAQAIKTLL